MKTQQETLDELPLRWALKLSGGSWQTVFNEWYPVEGYQALSTFKPTLIADFYYFLSAKLV